MKKREATRRSNDNRINFMEFIPRPLVERGLPPHSAVRLCLTGSEFGTNRERLCLDRRRGTASPRERGGGKAAIRGPDPKADHTLATVIYSFVRPPGFLDRLRNACFFNNPPCTSANPLCGWINLERRRPFVGHSARGDCARSEFSRHSSGRRRRRGITSDC